MRPARAVHSEVEWAPGYRHASLVQHPISAERPHAHPRHTHSILAQLGAWCRSQGRGRIQAQSSTASIRGSPGPASRHLLDAMNYPAPACVPRAHSCGHQGLTSVSSNAQVSHQLARINQHTRDNQRARRQAYRHTRSHRSGVEAAAPGVRRFCSDGCDCAGWTWRPSACA